MSEVLVGSAYSVFDLRYSGFTQGVSAVMAQLQQLRQAAAQPIVATVTAGASGGGAAGGASTALAVRGVADDTKAAEQATLRYASSLAQAQKAQGDLSGASQTYRAALAQLTPNTIEYNQALGRLATTEAQLAKTQAAAAESAALTKTETAGVGQQIGAVTGVLDTAIRGFFALKAAAGSLDFLKTAASASDARESMDKLAASSKTTGEAIITSLRAAADGTIRDSTLIQSANLGILLTNGRITQELPKLVEVARASAKATGEDVGFLFDSLVRGIARGSPRIIDNAGITLDAAKAFDTYAQSVGKTADKLTDAEKQQATLNAVLKTGGDIVKQVGLDGSSAAVNIDRATVAVQNLGEALAQKVAPFVGKAAGGIANLINQGTTSPETRTAGQDISGVAAKNAASYEDYVAKVTAANNQIKEAFSNDPFLGALIRRLYGIQPLTEAQLLYAQSLIRTGTAQATAVQQAQAAAGIESGLAEAQRQVIQVGGEREAGYKRLIPLIYQTSALGQTEQDAVRATAEAYSTGDITARQFEQVLLALAHAHMIQPPAVAVAIGAFDEERSALGKLQIQAEQSAIAVAKVTGKQIAIERSTGAGGGRESGSDIKAETDAQIAAGKKYLDGQTAILDSQIALAAAHKNTAQQIDLLRKKQADYTTQSATDVAARNQIEAQIIGIQDAAEKAADKAARARSTAANKGLSALDKSTIDLAGQGLKDYQAQLDLVNQKLAAGNLTALQRNELIKEQLTLQQKITDEQTKQQDAALSAAASAIENRKAQRQEARQLTLLDRMASVGGERGAEASDEAALIRIRAEQRTRSLNREITAAGGAVPTLGTRAGTAAMPIGGATPLIQPGGAAGGAANGVNLNITLEVGADVFASATLRNVQSGARVALRSNQAAGA